VVPGDAGPGCHGALVGPPDYSRQNTGTEVPGATAAQQQALVRANQWRTGAGLVALNANAQIQQAASAHAHFMAINPGSCYPGQHDEVTSCMESTGADPFVRMTAAGYKWQTASEVIDSANDGNTAVDGWIWTVYHRMPFMDARLLDTGFGLEGSHAVMDFGTLLSGKLGTTTVQAVYPLPGQTGVKPDFNGANEGPTPVVPPATKKWPSGTVISVTFNKDGFTIVSHEIYDGACQPVPHSAHSYADDPVLKSQLDDQRFFYMYSDTPLARGTTYTASVSAMVGGTPWSQTWSFTTQ
jgi:hypothetical protein